MGQRQVNMPRVKPIEVVRVSDSQSVNTPDLLACEEPLEIRLGYSHAGERHQKSISITMRMPDHDFELALGFLFSEGIIDVYNQIESVKYCTDGGEEENENIVRVELISSVTPDIGKLQRHFYTSSSCGVCGKSSIEAVSILSTPLVNGNFKVGEEVIKKSPHTLRQQQLVFDHTGGLHAAGLFTSNGELMILREDVGRHNALDKVIGHSILKDSLPLSDCFLLLSGRISFELVQKAIMAGIPLIAAVGAPSSLAVELAQKFNITLVGFVKDTGFNIYCGVDRVVTDRH